jgi:hypothetical protein
MAVTCHRGAGTFMLIDRTCEENARIEGAGTAAKLRKRCSLISEIARESVRLKNCEILGQRADHARPFRRAERLIALMLFLQFLAAHSKIWPILEVGHEGVAHEGMSLWNFGSLYVTAPAGCQVHRIQAAPRRAIVRTWRGLSTQRDVLSARRLREAKCRARFEAHSHKCQSRIILWADWLATDGST